MATKNIKIDFTGLSYDNTSTFSITSNAGDGPVTVGFNDLTSTGSGYPFLISDSATSITVASTNGVCITTSDTVTFEAAGITPTPTQTPGGTPPVTPTGTPASTPNSTPASTPGGTPPATPPSTPASTPPSTPGGTPPATPPSTPAPAPVSPTPTQTLPLYYTLTKCEENGTQSPGFRSTQNTSQISLSIGDRVENTSLGYTFIVDGFTTDTSTGGVGITDTGATGCPPVTYYYTVRECFDGAIFAGDGVLGDMVVKTTTDLSGWSHILIPRYSGDTNGICEIYNVTNKAAYDSNAGDYTSKNLDTISGVTQQSSCSGGSAQPTPTAIPPTPSPTPAPITPTPTQTLPLYYTLTKCEENGTQSPGFRSTQNTSQISLSIGDRVENTSLGYTFIVDGFTTDTSTGGVGITDTGATGCPPVTYYYTVRECFDGAIFAGDGVLGDMVVKTTTDLSGWSHILIPRYSGDTNGICEIYNVTNKAAYDSNAGDYTSKNLDTISGVTQQSSCSGGSAQPAPTPTPTATPPAPPSGGGGNLTPKPTGGNLE